MFVLEEIKTNRFFFGFVDSNQPVATLYEGINVTGGTRSKKELRCETQEEAWQGLCQQVVQRFSVGFRLSQTPKHDASLLPKDAFQGAYPAELEGVHIRFGEMSEEQLLSGISRVEELHSALSQHVNGVGLSLNNGGLQISLGSQMLALSRISNEQWETVGSRAKEMFTARQFVDSTTLLPSGAGAWWAQTGMGLLDLYLRSFLAGLSDSGVSFTTQSSCEDWRFDRLRPFKRADIEGLPWFSQHAMAVNNLTDLGLLEGRRLKVAPATPTTGFEFFL